MDRKEFLRQLMRNLLLVLIAVVSGLMLIKSKNADLDACPPQSICQSCKESKKCSLSQKKVSQNSSSKQP